jgi:hypothetical protein
MIEVICLILMVVAILVHDRACLKHILMVLFLCNPILLWAMDKAKYYTLSDIVQELKKQPINKTMTGAQLDKRTEKIQYGLSGKQFDLHGNVLNVVEMLSSRLGVRRPRTGGFLAGAE